MPQPTASPQRPHGEDTARGPLRSLLFVPADSPHKLDKALASGADALIVDLENSVAPDRKAKARAEAAAFLREALARPLRPRLFVRINPLGSEDADADLDAIVAAAPDAIVVPKAEGAATVIHADAKLCAREAQAGLAEGHIKIVAEAIETAAGLFHAGTFKNASTRLIGLSWGAEDLSVELGALSNRYETGGYTAPYRLARTLCLFAAAAAGVAAIETVYVDYRDGDGLRRDTLHARRDGFTARLAIHPAQVSIINDAFTPDAEMIAQARRVVEAFAAADGAGVIGLDGKMLDQPHLARALRVLAVAKAMGLG